MRRCEKGSLNLNLTLYCANTDMAPGGRDRSLGDSCRDSEGWGAWRLAARVPRQTIWRPVAPGDSRVASGDTVRQRYFACFGGTWSTRFWWYLEGWLAGVPWVVAQNVSLELWLGIGAKHIAFLELWLRMASL